MCRLWNVPDTLYVVLPEFRDLVTENFPWETGMPRSSPVTAVGGNPLHMAGTVKNPKRLIF